MRRYQIRPETQEPQITDIEVDGNTVRFINVRKGKAHEPSIIIESGRAKK